MKRISILTVGTRGDVQPFIALALGLQRAGYDVLLGAQPDYKALVQSYGIPFAPIGSNAQEMLNSQLWQDAISSGNVFKYLRAHNMPEMRQVALEIYREARQVAVGSDLVIYRNELLAGLLIAEHLKVPCVEVRMQPFSPTCEFPGIFLQGKADYGPLLNWLSGVMVRFAHWHMQRNKVNHFCHHDLKIPGLAFFGPDRTQACRNIAVLHPISTSVLPQPVDWPNHLHMTGYWLLPSPQNWQPSAELTEFIAAGSPPVYVGFGSMPSKNPQATYNLVVEALRRSGQRGIIASGWSGIKISDCDRERIFCVDSVPHEWLFPQVKAVIHHGGAGTSAAAMRAGVPSIVIPFFADQGFWGWRLAALGVGTEPLNLRSLSAEKLAGAVMQVLADKIMQQRAQQLSQAIGREDGVQHAINLIESLYLNPSKTTQRLQASPPIAPRQSRLVAEV